MNDIKRYIKIEITEQSREDGKIDMLFKEEVDGLTLDEMTTLLAKTIDSIASKTTDKYRFYVLFGIKFAANLPKFH